MQNFRGSNCPFVEPSPVPCLQVMHPRYESAEAESFLVVGLATRPEIHIDHIGDILYIRLYIYYMYISYYHIIYSTYYISDIYVFTGREMYMYISIYLYIYICVCEIMKPSINLIIYDYSI